METPWNDCHSIQSDNYSTKNWVNYGRLSTNHRSDYWELLKRLSLVQCQRIFLTTLHSALIFRQEYAWLYPLPIFRIPHSSFLSLPQPVIMVRIDFMPRRSLLGCEVRFLAGWGKLRNEECGMRKIGNAWSQEYSCRKISAEWRVKSGKSVDIEWVQSLQ